MKLYRWFKWLFWSLIALLTTSTFRKQDGVEDLFHCAHSLFCHKSTFEPVRSCWLILSSESKDVIQNCVKSKCNIHLPEFYSRKDICDNDIPYDKKKECFYVCAQLFIYYVKELEQEALLSYSSEYQNLIYAKDCFSDFWEMCSKT